MDWIVGIGMSALLIGIILFIVPIFVSFIYESIVYLIDRIKYNS